ncbi:fungal specific transcription factor domain-containing protein [Sarocladium implicatum]|nr:fungal specific transcription factor domain-containing protein [Sarocladium implicatum]
MADTRPKRHLRSTKACDYCHGRRIKCRISEADPARCQNCVDFDLTCESSRPLKRGKRSQSPPVGRLRRDRPSQEGPSYVVLPNALPLLGSGPASSREAPPAQPGEKAETRARPLETAWQGFAHTSIPLVQDLLSVYFETVYPIFPFFDRQSLETRLAKKEHCQDRGFFSSVMAACALSSARVRDGALASANSHPANLLAVPPETFFAAAQDTLSTRMVSAHQFDNLRACALLSIASIQNVEIDAMRMYIGHYFTMMATWGWHDESNWPKGLSSIEMEERRRLYWSMYTLDIFTSIVWDGCIHFQEAHALVQYPSGQRSDATQSERTSWIIGWNFTTDLYRRLEHVVARLRTRSSPFNMFSGTTEDYSAIRTDQIQMDVESLYLLLPRRFRELVPATGRLEEDIHGFQAANIQVTLALFRIALLTLERDVDLDKKCSVVSDVLNIFHQVPKAYQRAISTPLIYHMGGIGNILGSVMEAPLSESSYQRVRGLLLSMADLLESLESLHKQQAGAGRKLREQVDRIDAFMASRCDVSDLQGPNGVSGQTLTQYGRGDPLQQGAEDMNGISPLFQIPDELLQDWDWTFNIYQSQFPYFGDSS